MNHRLIGKYAALAYTVCMVLALALVLCPLKALAEEYENTSAMEPVQGTPDRLVVGEDGTLRYRIEEDFEIENAWVRVGENLYYFDNTGRALYSTLRVMDDNSYYFDENGICVNGLVEIDGDLYFFTPGLGMNTGWVSAEGDEDVYYFDEDGKAHKGFMTIEPEEEDAEPQVFYFDDDGRMHRGWLETDEGKMYFNEDGIRLLRWNEIDGELYYLKEYDNGYADTSDWLKKDGNRVYLSEDGSMLRNTTMTISGMDYRFDEEGRSHPNWISGIVKNSPYMLAFLLSTLLIYFSSVIRNKRAGFALGIGAVLVVTLLAAMRSTSVGIDISWYITRPFEWAAENEGSGFFDFMRFYIRMEPLFNILMYISVYILHSPHFAMGALTFITSAFISEGIRNKYGCESRWFAWLAYCLVFFNMTLNIMRQYVAVAILYYLFSDKEKLTWKRVIPLTILAMSIHYIGIAIIVFWIVYELLESRVIPKACKYLTGLLVALIPPVGPRLIGGIIEYLVENYNDVFRKYTYFIYGHESNNGYAPDLPQLLLVLAGGVVIVLGILQILRKQYVGSGKRYRVPSNKHVEAEMKFKAPAVLSEDLSEVFEDIIDINEKDKETYDEPSEKRSLFPSLPLAVAWFTDLGYCICSNIFNGRFQFCVSIFRLDFLTAPQKNMGKKTRRIVQAVLVIILIYYWLYMFVYLNNGRTSPYAFWFDN